MDNYWLNRRDERLENITRTIEKLSNSILLEWQRRMVAELRKLIFVTPRQVKD